MNDKSYEGHLLAIGCFAFLGIVLIKILACFGIGWLASMALSAFYPHDYPLWGFALVVFLITWLAQISVGRSRSDNRPKLSSSDNRYNPNNW